MHLNHHTLVARVGWSPVLELAEALASLALSFVTGVSRDVREQTQQQKQAERQTGSQLALAWMLALEEHASISLFGPVEAETGFSVLCFALLSRSLSRGAAHPTAACLFCRYARGGLVQISSNNDKLHARPTRSLPLLIGCL